MLGTQQVSILICSDHVPASHRSHTVSSPLLVLLVHLLSTFTCEHLSCFAAEMQQAVLAQELGRHPLLVVSAWCLLPAASTT